MGSLWAHTGAIECIGLLASRWIPRHAEYVHAQQTIFEEGNRFKFSSVHHVMRSSGHVFIYDSSHILSGHFQLLSQALFIWAWGHHIPLCLLGKNHIPAKTVWYTKCIPATVLHWQSVRVVGFTGQTCKSSRTSVITTCLMGQATSLQHRPQSFYIQTAVDKGPLLL